MAACLPSRADTPPVAPPALQLGLDGGLTATDNGGLSPPGQERADLITAIRPRVAYVRRSPRLEIDLAAAATLFAYANGTQKNDVLPEARAFVRSELVERWLYLDAGAQLQQTQSSSYGPLVDQLTGTSAQTTTAFRVSPYLLRDLTTDSFVLALYDFATENNGTDTGARRVSQRSVVRYELKPLPVGAAVEIARLDNETKGADDSRLTIDSARATASIALHNQMILGAIGGVERSDTVGASYTDPLYGASVLWNPGPRTSLDGTLEHRFFGIGGSLALRHRTPSMSFAVAFRRAPATVTSTLGQVNARSDLRPFLDAILTSRYPDPDVRRGLVDSVVDTRALDVRLPNPTSIVADYQQLQTDANATWVYLGTRNTASLAFYTQKLVQLVRDGDPPPPGGAPNDSRRSGASLQVGRRLEPLLSVDAVLGWSKITGLGERSGESSEEWVQRLVLRRALSMRTAVLAGVQFNQFTSNVLGQNDYKVTLAFIALRHNF